MVALGSQIGGIGACIVPIFAYIANHFANERTSAIIGTRAYKHQLDF
jgi:hypothetical protein